MKEINRGKQMKSVWEIKPPESWEKKFGRHPTQKPVALLERILLASSNEGDLVLDPFAGGGTTLLTSFRLRRQAFACELSLDHIQLTARRLCSKLAHVNISSISSDAFRFCFPSFELRISIFSPAPAHANLLPANNQTRHWATYVALLFSFSSRRHFRGEPSLFQTARGQQNRFVAAEQRKHHAL
jgi:hypothetical protein